MRDAPNRFSLREICPSWLYHAVMKCLYLFRRREDEAGRPPMHLAFVYGYDPAFQHVGETFAKIIIELCQLKPGGKILDIGSGIGRCALPLASYLNRQGEYHGVDVRKDGITWCRENISVRHPNFHFHHLDLSNPTYAPLGRGSAATAHLPFADGYFDAVFSKSVFTHMDEATIKQYLRETCRVLKPGGFSMHTFFLLNDPARQAQQQGIAQFNFIHAAKGGMAVSRVEPEKAIAFEESLILTLYQDAGLQIQGPVRYGSWSGRKDGLSGQDIVVAIKPAA